MKRLTGASVGSTDSSASKPSVRTAVRSKMSVGLFKSTAECKVLPAFTAKYVCGMTPIDVVKRNATHWLQCRACL